MVVAGIAWILLLQWEKALADYIYAHRLQEANGTGIRAASLQSRLIGKHLPNPRPDRTLG